MRLKRFLDGACIALASSSILDSVLWFTVQYHVPCWTIAVMSTCLIVLLQVLKRTL